jgi:dihydroneopterin aldolase
LTFEAILGVLEFERQNPQTIVVDVEFRYDYDKQKKDYVDYSKVAQDIQTTIKDGKFELVEEALLACETYIATNNNITNIELKISKPNIIKNCKVGVRL